MAIVMNSSADPPLDENGLPVPIIVLVDEHDRQVGLCEKLEAHRQGLLHRAFSVIIKNAAGQILLQKRAAGKYHSPGRWANACCGHPGEGDDVMTAAARRLDEEMGFTCALVPGRRHSYCADVGGGLIENEYVHVFFGRFDGRVIPNPGEASNYVWADGDGLQAMVAANPDRYSAWFRDYLEKFGDEIIAWKPEV
jgi:isopentenyl-diphosphate delta-isomerase